MWLASGRASCGPNTAATSSACSKPSSSAASQPSCAGVASWVRNATWSPRAMLHHAVARAAVRELALVDLVDDGAVAARDLERAVRRARVDDQDLELAVDLLRAHRAQHLVEVAGAVQHRDGDGDDAHVPRRRRRIAARDPRASRPDLLEALHVPQREAQLPPARALDGCCATPPVLELRLDRVPALQLGPQPVALRERLLERLLGAPGALLRIGACSLTAPPRSAAPRG